MFAKKIRTLLPLLVESDGREQGPSAMTAPLTPPPLLLLHLPNLAALRSWPSSGPPFDLPALACRYGMA